MTVHLVRIAMCVHVLCDDGGTLIARSMRLVADVSGHWRSHVGVVALELCPLSISMKCFLLRSRIPWFQTQRVQATTSLETTCVPLAIKHDRGITWCGIHRRTRRYNEK